MDERLPYYMAYPMSLHYDDERIERRDFDYMKSLYPEMAKKILPYVEMECDRMEYEGSMLYDEYPDQLQLRMMCSRIDQKVNVEQSSFVRDLITVIVYQESYKRRCDYRRSRHKFY